jgi:hypothetical protein
MSRMWLLIEILEKDNSEEVLEDLNILSLLSMLIRVSSQSFPTMSAMLKHLLHRGTSSPPKLSDPMLMLTVITKIMLTLIIKETLVEMLICNRTMAELNFMELRSQQVIRAEFPTKVEST